MPPKAEEVMAVAAKLGFKFFHQRGSHRRYRHPDGRSVTIPYHRGRELKKGIFRKLLRDINITEAEFNRLR
ncbi:MAG: addiction module toxin, HicA family [Dehalococcoidia bacterium]|nr:addiction module toxin, HicA family [Dehalococcoidia bacterium]